MDRFVVVLCWLVVGAAADLGSSGQVFAQVADETATGSVTRGAGVTAKQRAWLNASPEQRVRIAERIGEDGARALAKSKGYEPILDGFEKAIPQGPDQVYRAGERVVVYEAKGGSSQLGHAYGHPQGSPEWVVESAKRVLSSGGASAAEKSAAQEVLRAAAQGKLEVHVVRTTHVLGEPGVPVLEQSLKTSGQAMKLAREAIEQAAKPAAQAAASAAESAGDVAKPLAGATEEAAKAAPRASGKLLRGASKAAVAVGVAVDVGVRASDAAEVEAKYASGEITEHERVVSHAGNAGGFVGGWAGACGGAELGAAAGGAVGAFFGGIGAPFGAAIGGVVGGVAGYFGGDWAGTKAAEAAADAIHQD